jgi:CO/xanthine dehydrogenase FAD-binding subunit
MELRMDRFLRPTDLASALQALGGTRFRVMAGGTDYYPQQATMPRDEPLLDISALPGLSGIERHATGWRIGCLATWSDVIAADLPKAFDGLKQAARQVGGRQIQNAGTLAGNLCNASPAADGVPCLLALDAAVELASLAGRRILPLADFILGPRRIALREDEMVLAIHVPDQGGVACFEKLGVRAYLVISIAMVSAWARLEGGRIAEARVAVGSCGPVAIRLATLEAALVGTRPGDAVVTAEHLTCLRPLDDVRAPAWYRRDAALELVRRALAALAAPLEIAA